MDDSNDTCNQRQNCVDMSSFIITTSRMRTSHERAKIQAALPALAVSVTQKSHPVKKPQNIGHQTRATKLENRAVVV